MDQQELEYRQRYCRWIRDPEYRRELYKVNKELAEELQHRYDTHEAYRRSSDIINTWCLGKTPNLEPREVLQQLADSIALSTKDLNKDEEKD